MTNLFENSLKRYLKRKRRITLGFLVSFLITGGVSYSEVEIKYENGKITATSGTITNVGTNYTWTSTEDVDGVKIDSTVTSDSGILLSLNNKNNINSGTLSSNTVAYGIYASGGDDFDLKTDKSTVKKLHSSIGDINNTGNILANNSNSTGEAYGIINIGGIITQADVTTKTNSISLDITNTDISSTIGNITNKGEISATSTNGNAYGIFNAGYLDKTNTGANASETPKSYIVKIGDITNYGTISGSAKNTTNTKTDGYGIYSEGSNATIGDITNYGVISGEGKNLNAGISNNGTTININNIYNKNTGKIYAQNGVTNFAIYSNGNSSVIGDITNEGVIYGVASLTTGTSSDNSAGIMGSGTVVKIGTITNMNKIYAESFGMASGIFLGGADLSIEKVENNGVLYGKGNSAGNGINSQSGNKGIIKELTNTGKIYGEGVNGSGFGLNILNLGTIDNKVSGEIYGKGKETAFGAQITAVTNGTVEQFGKIINSGKIYGEAENSIGTGINIISRYSSVLEGIENENTGIISGTSTNGVGYGITIQNDTLTVKNIKNSGLISGSGKAEAIGIKGAGAILENIDNSGTISGEASGGIGYGIYSNASSSKLGNINNKYEGVVSGIGTTQGYGIYGKAVKEMGAITNAGEIVGKATTGEGVGIYAESLSNSQLGDIYNSGIISGDGVTYGYGIKLGYTVKFGNLKNLGIIYGKATGGKAYGFISQTGNSITGAITNNGTIYGTGTDESSGINLAITSTMETMVNTGMIYGESTKGIAQGITMVDGNIQITEINNSGTILGEGATQGYGVRLNSFNSQWDTINNSGAILGKASGSTGNGYGIFEDIFRQKVINNGLIAGIGEASGYAFESFKTSSNYNSTNAIINMTNTGTILGEGKTRNGYAFDNNKDTTEMDNLANRGLIFGNGGSTGYAFNNTSTLKINSIDNEGVIAGKGGSSGYAFYNTSTTTLGDITNSGVISGTSSLSGTGTTNEGYAFSSTGNFSINSITNNGIISGTTGIYNNVSPTSVTNNGLLVSGYGTDSITVEGSYTPIIVGDKTIINGIDENNSPRKILTSEINDKDNLIVNVVGNGENSIVVDSGETLSLSNSTINSVGTAVKVDGSFIANNLIINSGTDVDAITGADIALKNGTVVNGGINVTKNLSIESSAKLNGKLYGNNTSDLVFESSTSTASSRAYDLTTNNVSIYHDVDGFQNTTIGSNVTLFENVTANLGNITIKKGANLVLRLKPIGRETVTTKSTNGVTQINSTHAIIENTGTISSEGGRLLFELNGLGKGTILDLGKNKLDSTMKGKETEYDDDVTIDATSLLFTIELGADGRPVVHAEKDLPTRPVVPPTNDNTSDGNNNSNGNTGGNNGGNLGNGSDGLFNDEIKYPNINEIYQGMESVDESKNFHVTNDKELEGFIKYLADIYASNPYAYSSELSRKSMDMFKNTVLGRELRPNLHKWVVYGGLVHVDGGTKDKYYGRNYYSFDGGKTSIKTDIKLTGGYAQAEYGLDVNDTAGIIVGGTNSNAKISSSKLDGDAFYLGAYRKKYIGDLRVAVGAGYQYGDYKASRVTKDYNNILYDKSLVKTYTSNYNDNGFNLYLDTRYTHKLENRDDLYFEPYFNVGYTFVRQDGASEKGELAINTHGKDFDYLTAKIGGDLKKEVLKEKGKHIFKTGVEYESIMIGDKSTEIKGNFKGGKEFGILVPEKNNDIFTVNLRYEYEKPTGMLMDVVGSYSFARDNMRSEWKIGAGIGYKF